MFSMVATPFTIGSVHDNRTQPLVWIDDPRDPSIGDNTMRWAAVTDRVLDIVSDAMKDDSIWHRLVTFIAIIALAAVAIGLVWL